MSQLFGYQVNGELFQILDPKDLRRTIKILFWDSIMVVELQ